MNESDTGRIRFTIRVLNEREKDLYKIEIERMQSDWQSLLRRHFSRRSIVTVPPTPDPYSCPRGSPGLQSRQTRHVDSMPG